MGTHKIAFSTKERKKERKKTKTEEKKVRPGG